MQNLLVSDDMSNKSWFDYEIVKLGSNNHMREVVVLHEKPSGCKGTIRVRNGSNGPLVLGLIRDKGRLLRGQVSLAWESSKPLYIKRGDVSI